MKICRKLNLHATGYSICESYQASYLKNDDFYFSVMIGSPIGAFLSIPKSLKKRHCSKENMQCLHILGPLKI